MKIEFRNIKGKVITLDGKLTIGDLVKLGIKLNLEPQEKPKDPDTKWFYHTPKK